MLIYVVVAGDSLDSIAQRYNVSAEDVAQINDLQDPSVLAVGQALILPTETFAYTVVAGDTLSAIANRYGETLSQIFADNPMLRDRILQPGETVYVRGTAPKLGTLSVNGYAYTNIDPAILARTLPYLTYLTIFSYGVRPGGGLVPVADDALIAAARGAGVAPVMLLSTIGEDGTFNSQTAADLLSSEELQQQLIDELTVLLPQKGYYGIDVDFEYIPQDQAENYAAFMTRLHDAMAPLGISVFVALAPKTSATQRGLLYEAHDYAALGAAVDRALIMTYEWGYLYGPPMAVAPLREVRRVLQYAVTAIPPEKIFMGLPNYAYNWNIPFVQGTAAQPLTNVQAAALAGEKRVEIMYDTAAASPFFTYAENGASHEVWFEDARSVEAKLRLANEFKLDGVGVWNIMRWFGQLWYVLSEQYNIRKVAIDNNSNV